MDSKKCLWAEKKNKNKTKPLCTENKLGHNRKQTIQTNRENNETNLKLENRNIILFHTTEKKGQNHRNNNKRLKRKK